MPTIYITDETRAMLDNLTNAEKRSISDEIGFLCDKRVKELSLPDVIIPSCENNNGSKTECNCQEKRGGQ